MNAICLITFQPNKIWCDFLNDFKKYNIFVIIDDINFVVDYFEKKYTNINFIKIKNKKCQQNGYLDTNFTINKLISGWDKALYYFGVEKPDHDFVWFIEDDVYFYNESTVFNIDKSFPRADLLSNKCTMNDNGDKNHWHWHIININYEPPYCNGMMCAVRTSRKLLERIRDYAKINQTLFFLEALIPTIAIKNNLRCANIKELEEIHFRHDFDDNDVNKTQFFHPVKNIEDHILFRKNSQ